VLFPSERCVSVPGDMTKKTARLQRIALETAKQCDRGRVPGVTAIRSFEAAVKRAALAGLPLFLYEEEKELRLKQALEAWPPAGSREPAVADELKEACDAVSVMTGPEGGFEQKEADFAKSAGMIAVSLGPRILRCETAPMAALAAIMYHTGNI